VTRSCFMSLPRASLLAAGNLAVFVVSAAIAGDTVPPGSDPIIPGEIMVRVPDQAALAACVNALATQFPSVSTLDSIPGHGTYLIGYGLNPGQSAGDMSAALIALTAAGTIGWGELNYAGQASEGRTDTLWVSQLGVGLEAYESQYAVELLGLTGARARAHGGGVMIAVLDTGIDRGHPLLESRLRLDGANFATPFPPDSDGGDGLDNDGDGLVDEMIGHGTFVAGLVRLVAPNASILPVTVLDSDGIGTSFSVAKGLYFAVDRGAHVINMSLGSTYRSQAVEDATELATQRGAIVIAAAGNTGQSEPREYPASDTGVLGVAATDRWDVKAPFSSFGPRIGLCAPGHSEAKAKNPKTFNPAASIVSTLPGGGFGLWRGTSFSCGLVSGVAALVRAQHPDWPSDTVPAGSIVDAIQTTLADTAVPIEALNPGFEGLLGDGRLDALAATLAGPVQPPLGDLDGDGAIGAGDLSILLSAWGPCGPSCPADLNLDGLVGPADLVLLLGGWG